MASLIELEAAGKHYCEDDWDKLKNQHHGVDDLDLLKYCFSYAYMVALLHDNPEFPLDRTRYTLLKILSCGYSLFEHALFTSLALKIKSNQDQA